ncbi:unnamed protein product [Urochloa humidicola]
MGLGKVGSAYSLVVAVLHDVPEARRSRLISLGCIVREVESPPENHTHLAMADFVANKLRIWEFLEYDSLVYVYVEPKPVMKASADGEARIIPTSRCADKTAWPAGELGSLPSPYFNADTSVLEPSMVTTDAVHTMSPTPVAHRQDFPNSMFFRGHYRTIPLEDELALFMLSRSPDLNVHLANKSSKCFSSFPEYGAPRPCQSAPGLRLPSIITYQATQQIGLSTGALNR